ncbi:MAG: S9 family peptidase [Candidatus Krumholzibacteriaceae bacterium]
MKTVWSSRGIAAISLLMFLVLLPVSGFSANPFSPEDVLKFKRAAEATLSPNGEWIAYTVSVPRAASDEPGGAYAELWLVSTKTLEQRPFITGKVSVSGVRFSPDASRIAFLLARGDNAKTQVWMMPVSGGEAVQITSAGSSVSTFRWHPAGDRIAYVATTPQSKTEKELDKKGYGFIFYEENLKDRNLYVLKVGADGGAGDADQITKDCSVWSFEWSPDGATIAAAISPRNLVDQQYMFEKIYLVNVATKERRQLTDNPGKLGNFEWSPDGARIVYNAAIELKDHSASQVFVIGVSGGAPKNLTEPKFRGTVTWAGWKDKATIVYRASEGVFPTLSTVSAAGGARTIILDAKTSGLIFGAPDFTKDFKGLAFVASAPDVPGDVYIWRSGARDIKRLTTLNPWIADRALGTQKVVRYPARDGLEIEGVLVYPVGYNPGDRYPLVVIVHGGPESNYSNGWVTSYSEPAQVLAGRGYAVLLPNYRASTGYGLDFALAGYNDPAGKEFNDVADGIDYLVSAGIADRDRVGLGGGSYGGYAAAWFATYYTAKVKAVCMFVGISELASKRLTTDIPYEELDVHSGKALEDMWQLSLERSPIFWAHQSKTAVLILGGAADTRVHPSQSIELYRILKMHDHPAVRLVQYPGEGHGNAKQPGRIDVLYRQLDWYDWYVKDLKPLGGPMPPLDISDRYGLNLEKKETAK